MAAVNPHGSVDLVWSKPVAHIVINKPEKRNAVSLSMWKAIPYLISEIGTNPRASVVVVQGAGMEAFASGADITELEACMGSEERGTAYMDAVENAEIALVPAASPFREQPRAAKFTHSAGGTIDGQSRRLAK